MEDAGRSRAGSVATRKESAGSGGRVAPGGAPVAVVGGGLAGLAAAAHLARAGVPVEVFERADAPGGRARTAEHRGFLLNLGPHALYRGGAGMRVLRELGIRPRGGRPRPSGGFALRGGELHTFPGGPLSLLSTGLFGLRDRLRAAAFLAGLPRRPLAALRGVPLARWLESELPSPQLAAFVEAAIRLATYAHAPDRLCTAAALDQLRLATGSGVLYLDGGWESLVAALAARVREAGGRIQCGAGVVGVHPGASGFELALEDGRSMRARALVLALPPQPAAGLFETPPPPLRAAAEAARPVRAACLDVALEAVPAPARSFLLGIDEPVYASVHSSVARLAPERGGVVHVARYLAPEESPEPGALRKELEGVLDRLQPGWRERAVHRRFLPAAPVQSALVEAARGGLPGRPGPEAAGLPGLLLAGDWVGPTGLLADASLASGAEAARRLLGRAA